MSSVVVRFGAVAALLTVAGCGSSSGPAHVTVLPQQRTFVMGGVAVRSVERALLVQAGPPRPTAVTCRPSSSAERSAAPFGHTGLPLFTCELTFTGERASYVVQVLHNGCFVAERLRPGRAVYGCGADRS